MMFFIPKTLVTPLTQPRKTDFICCFYSLVIVFSHMCCPACRKMPPRGLRPAIVCWLCIAANERKGNVSAHTHCYHHRYSCADGGRIDEYHPRGRRSAKGGRTRLCE